jgi:hypothetical protein
MSDGSTLWDGPGGRGGGPKSVDASGSKGLPTFCSDLNAHI